MHGKRRRSTRWERSDDDGDLTPAGLLLHVPLLLDDDGRLRLVPLPDRSGFAVFEPLGTIMRAI